jgi:hypothetical protein
MSDLIKKNREVILSKWFEKIIETYPVDSAGFLERKKNRFQNPIGHTIANSIEQVLDELVSTMDRDKFLAALDGIVRIRSVQDFSPSQAVAFVFLLKDVIRELVEGEEGSPEIAADLCDLESRIDRVALLAFDKYMECREKLYEIKANETIRRTSRLLERANMVADFPRSEGDMKT